MSSIAIKNPPLNEVIQNLIDLHELTVAELARRVNLPQPTIQRITAGVYKNPRDTTLQPIADYFEVTMNQLRGFESIPAILPINTAIKCIPLINSAQTALLPLIEKNTTQYVISDANLGEKSFAMFMPDSSMDPVISKGATLIIDPSRTPHHGSFIVVKLHNFPEVIVRQLITDATQKFIKPLAYELNQLKMTELNEEKDEIIGVITEVRSFCENP